MLLGCIGDDFTGSGDLANTLAKQGMRTALYNGVPSANAATEIQAGVIALKSRSIDSKEAVKQSLQALEWLRKQGCQQFFFKYCSTFDSTPEGNIGPVADALADALGADCVIICPAFPGAGRTIYQGHLFVNDVLLNASGMEDHPLTPMPDADIRRWLSQQSSYQVGHVGAVDVLAGAERVGIRLNEEMKSGCRHIVVDAMRDEDLITIGEAAKSLPLITGGSGVALGLPANFFKENENTEAYFVTDHWHGQSGCCVILSGSCSVATRSQIATHAIHHPIMEITVEDVLNHIRDVDSVCHWLLSQQGLPLVYSSADPDTVATAQKKYGVDQCAKALESFFAKLARALVDGGVQRLIVAGGETSGAVVEGLELMYMEVGPEIDPGVPAMRGGDDLVLTLKSGNFGASGFFEKAANMLSTNNNGSHDPS